MKAQALADADKILKEQNAAEQAENAVEKGQKPDAKKKPEAKKGGGDWTTWSVGELEQGGSHFGGDVRKAKINTESLQDETCPLISVQTQRCWWGVGVILWSFQPSKISTP